MKLLFGTGNPAKLDVMRRGLDGMHLEILGLKDMDRAAPPVVEDGRTPLENARQKALAYYRSSPASPGCILTKCRGRSSQVSMCGRCRGSICRMRRW